jgi:hypothetical protein
MYQMNVSEHTTHLNSPFSIIFRFSPRFHTFLLSVPYNLKWNIDTSGVSRPLRSGGEGVHFPKLTDEKFFH